MVGNWKAGKLDAFNDKQQVKWFEEIRVLVQILLARGTYYCVIATYCWDSGLLWCYAPLICQELFNHSTWHNTSEDMNFYHIHRADTKSHRLWLPVTKLHKVIITAIAFQVVTAFSRQGQFHDCDSIILLPLGTDLYSNCMTSHSASGYNDLQVFPARCCQSCWCYQYSCRLLQWWNLPFWQAYCIDNSFASGCSTGGLITWSWVDIEFIFTCIGIPVQGRKNCFICPSVHT